MTTPEQEMSKQQEREQTEMQGWLIHEFYEVFGLRKSADEAVEKIMNWHQAALKEERKKAFAKGVASTVYKGIETDLDAVRKTERERVLDEIEKATVPVGSRASVDMKVGDMTKGNLRETIDRLREKRGL